MDGLLEKILAQLEFLNEKLDAIAPRDVVQVDDGRL